MTNNMLYHGLFPRIVINVITIMRQARSLESGLYKVSRVEFY